MARATNSLEGASVVLVSCLLAWSASAQPIDTALVVLERDGQHTGRSLEAWVELADALTRNEPRLRVHGAEVQAERGKVMRVDAADSGRAALASMRRLRQAGDRDGAAKAADQALAALEQADWRTTQPAFIEALAWRGALTGGQADLSFLFTVAPTFTFPEGAVPEEAREQVELQRQGKAKAARSSFVIDSPVPALVWLDGAAVGMTPATTVSLVAGRHRLAAFSPGFPLVQSVELLAPGAPVHLPFVESEDAASLRAQWAELAADVRRGQPKVHEALLARSGTRELLLVLFDQRAAEVWRLTERGASHEAVAEPTSEALVAAVRRLHDQVDRPLIVSQGPAPSAGRRPFPLLLAAAGGALAAVGVGVFAASRGDLAAAQRVPQSATGEYAQAISRARVSTYSSYALLGVGLLTAAAGVTWWFVQPETPAAVVIGPDGAAFFARW